MLCLVWCIIKVASIVDLGEVMLLQLQQIMLTRCENSVLNIIIYLYFGMQRCLWWKETSARGEAKHGQSFVETLDTVTASAGSGRVHNMELVTPNFQDLLASVTSHVDQASTTEVTSSALSFIYQAFYMVISCRRKLLVPQYHCVPSVHYKSSMTQVTI